MILSGGLSRRMGKDKSEKKIHGKTLLELVFKKANKQVGKILINSNKSKKSFNHLEFYEIIEDCIKGNLGPLVGVLSGIKWVRKNLKNDWLVCFPVDSPFFPDNIVTRFLDESNGYEVLIAKCRTQIHPVFSIWKVNSKLESGLENSLKNDERKIDMVIKKFKTKVVNFPYIGYDPFFNINTPDDLKKAEKLVNEEKIEEKK